MCWWGQHHDTAFLVQIVWTFATVTIPVLCVLVNTLQYHDNVDFAQDFETEDPQLVAPAWDETVARQWERVDEDKTVGPRFWTGPTSKFLSPNTGVHIPTRLWQATSSLQKNRQGGWLLRQLTGESRTAAEVVMDDALVQDDGIDYRCWEVTQDQDKASKIEKALYETQRDVKMETTFMS